jgi:hypothetical protein
MMLDPSVREPLVAAFPKLRAFAIWVHERK